MTLKIGHTYIINKGFANEGEVVLVKVHGKLFCRVQCPDSQEEWDTMISRLFEQSLIEKQQDIPPDIQKIIEKRFWDMI